jgi:hypothetical protein
LDFSPTATNSTKQGFRFSVEKQEKIKTKNQRLSLEWSSGSGLGSWCRQYLQGNERGTELGAIEENIVLEHAEDGVQQLSHNGDEGDHFGFPRVSG